MAKGGARPGAGRPAGTVAKSTLEARETRNRLVEMYHANAIEITQALIDKALEKDVPAIKELHDRVYGKAMQSIEMSGKDGEALMETPPTLVELAKQLDELRKHS